MSFGYTLLGVIDAGATATPSMSVTVPAGTTKLTVHGRNPTSKTVSSATFGAAALSSIGGNTVNAVYKIEAWQLDNPTAGTDTVTINLSAAPSASTWEILAWSGSATGAGSISGTAAANTPATTLNIPSALGEIPVLVLVASAGAPNTITDTSTPALTLIDKRLAAVTTVLGGSFSGVGAAGGTVATAFTIANGGGTKVAFGYSVVPAPASAIGGAGNNIRRRLAA